MLGIRVPHWLGRESRFFHNDHGHLSLRSGCADQQFRVGGQDPFRLLDCIRGPNIEQCQSTTLAECMLRCNETAGCGAATLIQLGHAQEWNRGLVPQAGHCLLRSHACVQDAQRGACSLELSFREASEATWLLNTSDLQSLAEHTVSTGVFFRTASNRRREVRTSSLGHGRLRVLRGAEAIALTDNLVVRVCAYLLRRPQRQRQCTSPLPTRLLAHISRQPVSIAPPQAQVAAHHRGVYHETAEVLGGGLNNMLMHIAQLLTRSCDANASLVMPRLAADPLANRNPLTNQQPTLDFAEIINISHFQNALRPCSVVSAAPRGSRVEPTQLIPIKDGWHSPLVARVYAAARPSAAVLAAMDRVAAAAVSVAGARWAAIHLPIECDWWWASKYCQAKPGEAFTRRCYSPKDVAEITQPTRQKLGATGAVLFYAADKVCDTGPAVCPEDFGASAVKVLLPQTLPYTFRNTVEQFLAVRAPAGFFGNSYSTFSKGVALTRAQSPGGDASSGKSFAYDCARIEYPGWPSQKRGGAHTSAVTLTHPGFVSLETIQPGRCRSAAATISMSWPRKPRVKLYRRGRGKVWGGRRGKQSG